jgi:hypothetical protein
MFFIDWLFIRVHFLLAGLLLLGVWALASRRLNAWRSPARITARVTGLILSGTTSLILLLVIGCEAIEDTSKVWVYSPDGTMAIFLRDTDDGALGGSTDAYLVWDHGIFSRQIFVGDWGQLQANHVHWTSNSGIELTYYREQLHRASCGGSTHGVAVRCVVIPEPLN